MSVIDLLDDTRILWVVHYAAFNWLKLVVVIDFNAIMNYESEEDIQSDLESTVADLR